MNGERQTAPALIRTGVYTALGGALLAGGAAAVLLWLNPPPKVAAPGGCGCGCSGTSSAATRAARVYG